MKTLIFDFAGVLLFQAKPQPGFGMDRLYAQISKPSFQDYFYFNQELLEYLKKIKPTVQLAIFTNSSSILTTHETQTVIEPLFENVFKAHELQLPKNLPTSYSTLFNKLGVSSFDVFYTDDKEDNALAAQAAGATSHVFTTTPLLISKIKVFLEK